MKSKMAAGSVLMGLRTKIEKEDAFSPIEQFWQWDSQGL
jgi:hypothetical protein